MNYGLEIELLTADKNRFKDAAERARKDADDNHLAWCKAKEAHETLILALRETDRLLACEPQAWTQAKTDQMRRNQELIHGIPHDKGEQRCQAVGGDAEGKVPTTAPDHAQEAAPVNTGGSGDAPLTRHQFEMVVERNRLDRALRWLLTFHPESPETGAELPKEAWSQDYRDCVEYAQRALK